MAAHDGVSTSSVSSFTYDVFLSFRGEDTRNNFTGFLYRDLKREGINAFIDSEGLWGGEEIQTALLHAIQRSKISIPVFSKGYADSKWCLMELVEIVRCHRSNNQKVLPIFLDVEPRDVRHQTGSFEGSFQKHMERYDAQKIQSWKDALSEVAGKKGFQHKNQPELVKLVVNWALSELSSNRLSDVRNPVGLDDHVKDLLCRLKIDSNDVRFVGICGIGGIGKTTIATKLYNCIYDRFEMSCFLPNVREEASSGQNGVVSLQEKLIYSVSKKEVRICNVYEGQQLIKERLCGIKVLLILDDVDSSFQLEDLAIKSIFFGRGSRIIITTRDKQILNVAKVDEDNIYWPKELDDEQSLQLFSLHAFSSDQPPKEYLQLSLDVVHLAGGGLPLALEVLGSTFSDKDNREEEVWKSILQELKRMPHEDVYKSLKLSYDKLKGHEKCIFLDAACFLVGRRKSYIIQIWDACGFNPISAIRKLTQRSLLKFETSVCGENDDVLRMHDQIRAMGKGIVHEENPTEPIKRSRLWSCKELLEALEEPERAEMLEVIYMRRNLPHLHRRDFARMSKLRFIDVVQEDPKGNFPHLPPNLRWFSWSNLTVPAKFYHLELVHMNLHGSQIREAWTKKPQIKNQRFRKLKVLLLQHCDVSDESLHFSWFPSLETLDLYCCKKMVNLHKSIGDLKSLVELNLGYTGIKELPNSICSLSSLNVLTLRWCSSLKNLPESIGDLKSLVKLDLEETRIEEIPSSIHKLSCLEVLILKRCSSLKNLPESIGDLKSLVELDLEWTRIEEIPSSIHKLSCLEVLNLRWCSSLKNLPESIGDLKSLVKLDLEWTGIEEIPSSIHKLSCLEVLNLRWCSSLKNLLESIGDLKSLVKLDLGHTKIEELPNSICSLNSVKVLNLRWCSALENLPKSIGDLKSLITLDLEETKIKEIPSSIYKLSYLEVLNLKWCLSLENLPESIGDLKSLVELDLERTRIEEIPRSIYKLSCLKVLNLRRCLSLKKLPESIGDLKSLVTLDLEWTKVEEIPSSIYKLSCLKTLNLRCCSSLKNLPESIGDLKSLVTLDLEEAKIEEIPSSIWLLEKLEQLTVRNCHNLIKLPMSSGRTRCLLSIDLTGTKILLRQDDSEILLPSLVNLYIGDNLESSLPLWICGLPRLQHLKLMGCTKLELIPYLPSTLTNLGVSDCMSLQTLPDLSSLKHLWSLRLDGCKELKEIRGFEGTESLGVLWMFNCKALTNTGRWKIHGQGIVLVDKKSQGINNYPLNVNDGIHKGLILCVVFELQQNIPDIVQEGQLVDISLTITAQIRPCKRRRWNDPVIRCHHEVVIEGVEYTASKRDIIYDYHFKRFDWFGIPLEPRMDAIQVTKVSETIRSSNGKGMPIHCEVKFWKVLLESTASEQQQEITNQEEESTIPNTTTGKMVADFFEWSDDDEDHERCHDHFVPDEEQVSDLIEGSNPVPQQSDEESSNEMINLSHNDLMWLGLGLLLLLPVLLLVGW